MPEIANPAQWVTLLTVLAGFAYQAWRENRQRRWDQEDRAQLATKVVQAAVAVTAHAEGENAKLASAIQATHDKTDDLAAKTETIRVQTNGNLDTVKRELAEATERIAALQALTETLLAEKATRLLHDRRGRATREPAADPPEQEGPP